jgi:hypothetical protein
VQRAQKSAAFSWLPRQLTLWLRPAMTNWLT